MFRLKVKFGSKWKWGVNDYTSREAAQKRVEELRAVGIISKIEPLSKLLN